MGQQTLFQRLMEQEMRDFINSNKGLYDINTKLPKEIAIHPRSFGTGTRMRYF